MFVCSSYQGIEQQLEGAVGLGAVLGPEADQDHPAFLVLGRDHPGFLGQGLFADEPAALKQVAVGLAPASAIGK